MIFFLQKNITAVQSISVSDTSKSCCHIDYGSLLSGIKYFALRRHIYVIEFAFYGKLVMIN